MEQLNSQRLLKFKGRLSTKPLSSGQTNKTSQDAVYHSTVAHIMSHKFGQPVITSKIRNYNAVCYVETLRTFDRAGIVLKWQSWKKLSEHSARFTFWGSSQHRQRFLYHFPLNLEIPIETIALQSPNSCYQTRKQRASEMTTMHKRKITAGYVHQWRNCSNTDRFI